MERPVPSLWMLLPGPWQEAAEIVGALDQAGIAAQIDDYRPIKTSEVRVTVVDDEHLDQSFSWGRAGALAVERSRGYADIEPELAWDQWQLVRRTLE